MAQVSLAPIGSCRSLFFASRDQARPEGAMGAVCCQPSTLNAVKEVKEESATDSSRLQAYGAEVLVPEKCASKGKGKGKNASAPKAAPPSKGKGKSSIANSYHHRGSQWNGGCGARVVE